MKVLVAGGTGFIGAAVTRELLARGHEVAVMSHRPEAAAQRFPGQPVEVRAGDARYAVSLGPAVAGMEAVVSAMQFPNFPIEKPKQGFTFEEVDARGNERLVAAARDAGVQTYVYFSGAGAAPDAPKHWFRAKWQAEEAIRAGGLRYTILRPSWVYGPEDKALNRFVGFARRLPFVPVIGNGKQRLQPVFIDDVARCAADSLTLDAAASAVFEIGGPEVLTMDGVLRAMLSVMGKRRPLLHAPAFIPRIVGALMSPLPKPPLSPDAVDFITADAVADTDGLLKAFQTTLTPLREGLATYLAPTPQSQEVP
jgi:NADH dehydrogenase